MSKKRFIRLYANSSPNLKIMWDTASTNFLVYFKTRLIKKPLPLLSSVERSHAKCNYNTVLWMNNENCGALKQFSLNYCLSKRIQLKYQFGTHDEFRYYFSVLKIIETEIKANTSTYMHRWWSNIFKSFMQKILTNILPLTPLLPLNI